MSEYIRKSKRRAKKIIDALELAKGELEAKDNQIKTLTDELDCRRARELELENALRSRVAGYWFCNTSNEWFDVDEMTWDNLCPCCGDNNYDDEGTEYCERLIGPPRN